MSEERNEKRKGRKTLRVSAAIGILILLLLLFLRGCPEEPPFNYFYDKAVSLDKDPDKALAWVRDEVRTYTYRGDVKGALGTLWEGGGSPEEKRALLNAIWKHCKGERSGAGLDDVAPKRDKAADVSPNAASRYRVVIYHRRWIGTAPAEPSDATWAAAFEAAQAKDRELYTGPVGALLGDVHSVIAKEKATRIEIRAHGSAHVSPEEVARDGILGEALVFRLEAPGREEPLVVTRELWRADNRVGARETRPGDRHDFVVLPCRIGAFVQEKEKVLLEARGRTEAPEAEPYEALLDYASKSDEFLAGLEEKFSVRAQFKLPRILILSKLGVAVDSPLEAFDLRLNQPSFEGELVPAYHATQIRSFYESGFEHEWLVGRTGAPATSGFDAFNRVHDTFPDSYDRRVRAVYRALNAMAEHGGGGARVVFRGEGGTAEVTVRRTDGGFHVRSGPVHGEFAAAGREKLKLHIKDGRIDHVYPDAGDAAVAVECGLTAADTKPGLPVDFTLEMDLGMGQEPLLAPGAYFAFAWGEGAAKVRETVEVSRLREGLQYAFHTRRGLRTARGRLTVGQKAVEEATRHNPFYRSGTWKQDDATSFCVSRKVYEALKRGESTSFELLAKLARTDDPKAPRRVAWSGQLVPKGTQKHRLEINGVMEDVQLLVAEAKGAPMERVTILDDPRWPIGMADALVSALTPVRCRLVDENGIGIGAAEVRLAPTSKPVFTWPDGGFRLPPPPGDGGYGKVELQVTQTMGSEKRVDKVAVDLTAPGTKVVQLQTPRLRIKFEWINPKTVAKLDALDVSAQVKRHARAHLAQSRIVVIPTQMLPNDMDGITGFYSYDPAIGQAIGVTESGLHGTQVNWWAYGRLAQTAKESKFKGAAAVAAPSPLHAIRGATTALFLYSTYRLQGHDSATTVQRLYNEMKMWQARTNLFNNFGSVAGGQAQVELVRLLNKGLPGAGGFAAANSFYLGYAGMLEYMKMVRK